MPASPRRVTIPGSEKAPLKEARLVGPTPRDERFQITLRLRSRTPLPKGADTDAQTRRGERMNRDEWEAKYGADPEDIAKVESFARQHGLTVVRAEPAQRTMTVSGTTAAFSEAFGVTLNTYQHDDKQVRARTGPISIPSDLDGIVVGVLGLDNRPFARPHVRFSISGAHGGGAAAAVATLPRGFTPKEIATLYNFPAAVNGSGQTVAILELGGGFRQSELQTYFSRIGVQAPTVTVASYPQGGTNQPGTNALDPANADVEVMLDIEVVGAVSPGARIVTYFAPDASDKSFLDGLTAIVHDRANNPSIVSISWGGPESTASGQFQQQFNQVLQAAAHLGITVCVAAGDNGSADFPLNDPTRPWDGHAHVDFPASSPFVLACGGTMLTATATVISDEVVWHSAGNEGTGGGVSRAFPLPSYQAQAGVPRAVNPDGPVGRGVPDVAGDAAQESGYQVLCDGLNFPDPNHAPPLPPVGGTSAVAPLWAGLIARINQALGHNVGFVNPLIYALPKGTPGFRDIVDGNNGDYQAGRGWDPCTGLGVPNGQKLLEALTATVGHTLT